MRGASSHNNGGFVVVGSHTHSPAEDLKDMLKLKTVLTRVIQKNKHIIHK